MTRQITVEQIALQIMSHVKRYGKDEYITKLRAMKDPEFIEAAAYIADMLANTERTFSNDD